MQILPITTLLIGFWKNTSSEETENLDSFSKDKHEKKGMIPILDRNVQSKEQTAKGCQDRNGKVQCT